MNEENGRVKFRTETRDGWGSTSYILSSCENLKTAALGFRGSSTANIDNRSQKALELHKRFPQFFLHSRSESPSQVFHSLSLAGSAIKSYLLNNWFGNAPLAHVTSGLFCKEYLKDDISNREVHVDGPTQILYHPEQPYTCKKLLFYRYLCAHTFDEVHRRARRTLK